MRGSRRGAPAVAAAVREDAADPVQRWLWRPMLWVQLAHYSWALALFLAVDRGYAPAGDPADPTLHENHLGMLIQLARQPHAWVLGTHLAMAWAWLGVVLLQKHLVAEMSAAIDADRPALFARHRRIHAVTGTAMLAIGVAGIVVSPILALVDRSRNAETWYLAALVGFFLPALAMTGWTARSPRVSIRWHRFWAEITFVGAALSSLWSQIGIYVLGRSPLGPLTGEIVATQSAGVLTLLVVVWPAWRSLQRGLAADVGVAPLGALVR